MSWFRSRGRWGAGLALFALACQLVLSFGHVHAGQFVSSAAAAASQSATASADKGPTAPAHPEGLADEFCAICSLINLAGSLMPSTAPALHVPMAVGLTSSEYAVTPALTVSSRTQIQARAPPFA
jgi:hypothetical protein